MISNTTLSAVTRHLKAYYYLMRLDKPVGTLLLLWPTLWALMLSTEGQPSMRLIIIFMLGVFLTRSAGCVINDIADRKFDGHVERTKNRPLAQKVITTSSAVFLFLVLCSLALFLVRLLDWMVVWLSVVAVLLLVIYPFMKRWIAVPQVVLGVAFSWAIPMAWLAQSGSLEYMCWLLFLANLCWTVAYDTQYALVDKNDDLKIGIRSSAIFFGKYDLLAIYILQVVTLLLLLSIGIILKLNMVFYISLLVAGWMFIQQARWIQYRDRLGCFKAFLNNNRVGIVLTLGIIGS